MREETIYCNNCKEQIQDVKFFSITPGKQKKVGVTLPLAGRRHRIHLLNNAQLRVSLDTYVISEDGSTKCGQIDLHWKCLTQIVKDKLYNWCTDVWREDEDLDDA